MEKEKLMECLDNITGCSDEVLDALDGLELLREQGESLIGELEDLEPHQIGGRMIKLFTWLDLMKITLNHAKDNTRFVQEETQEIRTDGYKELKAIQGGA